jgi:hypothetical protein
VFSQAHHIREHKREGPKQNPGHLPGRSAGVGCVVLREHRRGTPAQHRHPPRCISGKSQDGTSLLEKKSDPSEADLLLHSDNKVLLYAKEPMGRNSAPVAFRTRPRICALLLQKSGLLASPMAAGKLWGGTGQKEGPEPRTASDEIPGHQDGQATHNCGRWKLLRGNQRGLFPRGKALSWDSLTH